MNAPVIIDLFVALVLLGFLVWGARRGLVRTAASLLIAAAALIGAGIAANTLTPAAGRVLQPVIERQVEKRVDEALSTVRPEKPQLKDDGAVSSPEGGDGGQSLEELLSLLDIDSDPASAIAERAEALVREEGVDLLTAVVRSVANSILHAILFCLSFVLLLIALKLLAGALDLAAKLPGLHALNALGGGAVGLVQGALALFLAVWVLRQFGVSFEAAADQTVLLRFFAAHTPLSALSALR